MHTREEIDKRDSTGGESTTEASPLEQTLATLWKRRVAFVLCFALTLGAVAAVTFLLDKVYSTSAYILVEPGRAQGGQFGGIETTNTLAKTYSELLQSETMANRVASVLDYELGGKELLDSISVAPVTDTQLLAVEAEGSTPERARVLANTYAAVFLDRVLELNEAGSGSAKLTVAEYSALPTSPARPKPQLYLLVGALLAAALAAAIVLLRERLAQRFEVDVSTTRILGRSVVGRIPFSRDLMRTVSDPSSPLARALSEPFRLLYTNLMFVTVNRRPLSVAMVSAGSGEGKSVCAVNLALVAGEFDGSVLLVDADLRRGEVSTRLGVESDEGLSSLLSGGKSLNRLSELTVDVPGTRLRVLPAGKLPPNAGALLGSDALWRFDSHARAEYDLVIYDCPPMSIGADASLIAAHAEGVLMVIDAERTRRKAAVQALDQLERTDTQVFGVILNRAPGADTGYYYAGARDSLIEKRLPLRRRNGGGPAHPTDPGTRDRPSRDSIRS